MHTNLVKTISENRSWLCSHSPISSVAMNEVLEARMHRAFSIVMGECIYFTSTATHHISPKLSFIPGPTSFDRGKPRVHLMAGARRPPGREREARLSLFDSERAVRSCWSSSALPLTERETRAPELFHPPIWGRGAHSPPGENDFGRRA